MHNKKLLRTKKRLAVARKQKVRKLKLLGRHPFAIPIATFCGLVAVTALAIALLGGAHKVRATNSLIVIISHDHVQQTVPTREPTVGALLKKLNIPLNQGDVVEPAAATPIDQDQFRINVYRAVPVEVVDGGQQTYSFSAATTSRSIAQQAGITVYPEDDLSTVPTTNFVKEGAIGERVVINRATPVDLNLYGTPIVMRTHAKTVADLLSERDINLEQGDTVQPEPNTPIAPNQQIFIIHKGIKIVSAEQDIPMPTQTINDPSLALGTRAIRQQGTPGKQIITYQIKTQNGKEVARTVIQKVTVQPPVQQIVVVGTNLGGIKGDMALAGISASEYNSADYVIEHESHWNPGSVNGSGCAGLGQACPGSKLAAACPNWQYDPVCQLRFFTGYASKYGGWNGAAAFWSSHGWW